VAVNGIELYYEEHGSGSTILCIHGTSSSALAWVSAIPTLAELGRVVAYDRRGCHRSERPQPYETTTTQEHTDDARALLRALDAAPAVVIGRSYGGNIALDLAMRYPECVRATALLEAIPAGLSAEADVWESATTAKMEDVASSTTDAVGEAFIRDARHVEELPASGARCSQATRPPSCRDPRGDPVVDVDSSRRSAPRRSSSPAPTRPTRSGTLPPCSLAIPNARARRSRRAHGRPHDPAVPAFVSETLGR
jgi:pimeloyl-ACP methyl ester carboxylesterase